jgi:SAM-dependent methyltransferase
MSPSPANQPDRTEPLSQLNDIKQLLATTPIIDCRSEADFQLGHLQNSTSIPYQQLFERMHELPKRDQIIALCGDQTALDNAKLFLSEKGYQIVCSILFTPELCSQLENQGLIVTGSRSRQLWQPASFIREFSESLSNTFAITPGKGLDIGCGSGRDMVFLAQQGWSMSGIDFHQDAISRAQALAYYNQVNISTHHLDLESTDNPLQQFQEQPFDLISVFRYLHRPLLSDFDKILSPGGVVLYQTFMRGCETIGRPRNPRFLLEPGELADHFSHFDILVDTIETLADGRPVSRFLARKR